MPESRKRSTGAGLFDSVDDWDNDFDFGLSSSKKSSNKKTGALHTKPMPAIKQPLPFGHDFANKKKNDEDFLG